MIQLAVSPCSTPDLSLEEALDAYSRIGYRRMELFTSWARSAVTPDVPAGTYLALAARHGFTFSAIHLPPLADEGGPSVAEAARVARLGAALGCPAAIVKAESKRAFADHARSLLDAMEVLPVTPVVQNHAGTAITTLEDCLRVLDSIDDVRMKALLEVGHYHTVGVAWPKAYEALHGRIAHVHIKDQVGRQSVPFGTGEIDLGGFFARLRADGYDGDVVIEMEVADKENTLTYLAEALTYSRELLA
jgi:sugar phosphate isomerase/epimerase